MIRKRFGLARWRFSLKLWRNPRPSWNPYKESGEPIYNAIVWQDRRTADYCAKLIQDGHLDMVQEKTGLLIDSYFSATKIKWILDNVKGARKLAERKELAFGTIDSWLIWNLTNG